MKRLVRLYPRAWRERYGAELADLLGRRRASLGEAIGLIRGALDAHLHPSLTRAPMVFVPEIGFRPASTRVLREPAETLARDTSVTIVAAAAGPDQTDVLVEWDPPEATGEDAKWLIKIDRRGVYERPALELATTLVVGGERHAPLRTEHRFRSASGYDLRELVFPPILPGPVDAQLEVVHAEQVWSVPLHLVPGDFTGDARRTAVEHEGITITVTAAARHEGRVVVSLLAASGQPGVLVSTIGTGGGPGKFPAKLKMPSSRAKPAHPIVLHDDGARRYEEVVRMRPSARAQEADATGSWPLRITSIFDVASDARSFVLTVPCVVVAEPAPPVVVDLRSLPHDFELGSHRLRALATGVSPDHPSSTRITFQLLDPKGPRQLLGPGRLLAQGVQTDMSFRGAPDEHQIFWMDTDLPDAQIVTLKGALVRVDGPWRLPIAFD
jgi:hypothetical protein